eukprot:gene108-2349_t
MPIRMVSTFASTRTKPRAPVGLSQTCSFESFDPATVATVPSSLFFCSGPSPLSRMGPKKDDKKPAVKAAGDEKKSPSAGAVVPSSVAYSTSSLPSPQDDGLSKEEKQEQGWTSDFQQRLKDAADPLTELTLSGKFPSPAALSRLMACMVESPNVLDAVEACNLQHGGTLRHLYIGGNAMGDEGAAMVVAFLATQKALSTLYINNNAITEATLPSLKSAVAACQSLTSVVAYGNQFSNEDAE